MRKSSLSALPAERPAGAAPHGWSPGAGGPRQPDRGRPPLLRWAREDPRWCDRGSL